MNQRERPPVLGTHPTTGEATYCAPWCGGKCRLAAFEKATKEAALLAARLGPGWTPEVWENLGWHYAAGKGRLRLHPSTRGSSTAGVWEVVGYTAFLNAPEVQTVARGETAEAAVEEALTIASNKAAGLHRAIADVRN